MRILIKTKTYSVFSVAIQCQKIEWSIVEYRGARAKCDYVGDMHLFANCIAVFSMQRVKSKNYYLAKYSKLSNFAKM